MVIEIEMFKIICTLLRFRTMYLYLQTIHHKSIIPIISLLLLATNVWAVAPGVRTRSFTDIIDQNKPAVVYIQVKKKGNGEENTTNKDILENIFGDDSGWTKSDPFFKDDVSYGFGSGFIFDSRGYILTNSHVVKNATEVMVTLADRTDHKAEIIGLDPKTDIGLIKIEGNTFPSISLGDSDTIKTGQWVLAFGSPYQFIQSVTAGIISATGRHTLGLSDYEDYIQTDAAINPGNSGGPLVDTEGEVIGINTAFLTQTGGYMGIGFAIPINIARSVAEQLLKDGKVTRAWLGVAIQDAESNTLEEVNLAASSQAAEVVKIVEGSPAEKAGLRKGDLIISIGGSAIKGASDLRNRIALTSPGTDVEIELYRAGIKQSFTATLAPLE